MMLLEGHRRALILHLLSRRVYMHIVTADGIAVMVALLIYLDHFKSALDYLSGLKAIGKGIPHPCLCCVSIEDSCLG